MKTLKENLAGRDVSEDHIKEIDKYIKDFHDALTCECLGDERTCYYEFVKIDGKYYKRDTTSFDVNDYCHDCGVENKAGNTHHGCCDMEMCVVCGGQFLLDSNHDEIELLPRLPKGAKLSRAKYDYRHQQQFLNDDIWKIVKARNEK